MLSLALALLLMRGIMVCCAMPPLEGWDEYQHLGYIEFLNDNARVPILGRDMVPPALCDAVRRRPQPAMAAEQFQAGNALSYTDFWEGRQVSAHTPTVSLYQAQHPPLYYALMAPILRTVGLTDIPLAVAVLRLANLAMLMGAVAMVFLSLRRIVSSEVVLLSVLLLMAANPMFLLSGLRVANDAAAILLGAAGFYLALRAVESQRTAGLFFGAAGAGLVFGVGTWCKSTALLSCLATAGVLLCGGLMHQWPWRRVAVCALVLFGMVILVIGPLLVSNLQTYGVIFLTQEGLANSRRGVSLVDLAQATKQIPWKKWVERWWYRQALWRGGWSMLRPPNRLQDAYSLLVRAVLVVGGVCAITRLWRTRRTGSESFAACVAVVVCVCTTIGLAWHAIQSQLAWSMVTTNPWYAATGIPFFLLLFVVAARAVPWRHTVVVVTLILAAIFTAAELDGVLWRMPLAYGQTTPWRAMSRVATLQPAGFGVVTLFAAASATLVLWIAAASLLVVRARKAQLGTPQRRDE